MSLIVLVLLACAGSPRCQDLLVQARRVVVAADTVLDNGTLLVRQGKVAYVGNEIPADARGRATVVDYGNAVIVPGFVLAQSTLGQDQDLGEGALAFTPDLRVAEAFDRWQEELDPLPRCGITSVALSASPRNVAGGIAALVKPGKAGGTIAVPEMHLSLSLAQAARNPERQPTSLMGAMDLLRTRFAAARTGTKTGPDAAVLAQVLQGSRRLFVYADTYTELSAALDFAKEFALEPVLVGASEAEKVLPRLLQQKASVVLGTLLPDARLQQLRLPATLAQAGVPFCFGGSPDQLRLSAVLAVVHGLDRKTALQALTRLPALLLDQQANVGSLRQACAADFLVFSGDPLDLSSAHIATWIDGVRVHGEGGKAVAASTAPSTVAGGQ